jgi:hypothetical protein
MNLFEIATREGYMFPSKIGELSVSDIWNLPLTSPKGASLDAIAITLYNESQDYKTVSFVSPSSTNAKKVRLENMLEIIKHIIAYKQNVAKQAKESVNRAAQKQKILDALNQKQQTNLQNMTEEELAKALEELNN